MKPPCVGREPFRERRERERGILVFPFFSFLGKCMPSFSPFYLHSTPLDDPLPYTIEEKEGGIFYPFHSAFFPTYTHSHKKVFPFQIFHTMRQKDMGDL